jgi:deoxycytidylate deaminase
MIINAGIVRVLFVNSYPDDLARQMFAEADVETAYLLKAGG